MLDGRRLHPNADRSAMRGAGGTAQPLFVSLVACLWIAALALFAWCVVLEHGAVRRIEFTLVTETIRPELGRAYLVDLRPELPPWLGCRGDTLSTGSSSDLELREDGVPLGPACAAHQSIRDDAGGRFSHWHQHLIFSASDGSDPRTNGRVYTVSATPRAAAWIETTAALLALAATLLGVIVWGSPSGRMMRLLPLGAFVLTAVLLLVLWNATIRTVAPSFAGVQADSSSYLDASTIRTIGYPLILRAITAVAGDLRPLVTVQVNALILSYILLSASVAVVLGR
ncbi:MAG: hypothetical protein FJ253_09705, partial [Phycisphaerae bacterium]|nr:hypothetical protein [Phycisphaerae bacterium]